MSGLFAIFRSNKIKSTTPVENTRPEESVIFHVEEAHKMFQTGNYQQALFHCDQALSQDATNAVIYRLRGVVLYELQDFTGATQDLHNSLSLA